MNNDGTVESGGWLVMYYSSFKPKGIASIPLHGSNVILRMLFIWLMDHVITNNAMDLLSIPINGGILSQWMYWISGLIYHIL